MTVTGELLLHIEAFWVSPWVCTSWIGLREKGVPFTVARALLSEAQDLLPTYRALSVTGRLPALQHGPFWVAESSAIVEYLEDAFPPPRFPALFPADLPSRARARQVMSWLRSDLDRLRDEWDSGSIFYPSEPAPLSPAGQRDLKRLLEVSERLIPVGATTLFDAWCIADLDLAFTLRRLVANAHPLPAHLARYVEVNWERPSLREFCALPRPPHRPNWRPDF